MPVVSVLVEVYVCMCVYACSECTRGGLRVYVCVPVVSVLVEVSVISCI